MSGHWNAEWITWHRRLRVAKRKRGVAIRLLDIAAKRALDRHDLMSRGLSYEERVALWLASRPRKNNRLPRASHPSRNKGA